MTQDHRWIVQWTYGESTAKVSELVQTSCTRNTAGDAVRVDIDPDGYWADIDVWKEATLPRLPRYRTYPSECELR